MGRGKEKLKKGLRSMRGGSGVEAAEKEGKMKKAKEWGSGRSAL